MILLNYKELMMQAMSNSRKHLQLQRMNETTWIIELDILYSGSLNNHSMCYVNDLSSACDIFVKQSSSLPL
jgi:hypothetical protein